MCMYGVAELFLPLVVLWSDCFAQVWDKIINHGEFRDGALLVDNVRAYNKTLMYPGISNINILYGIIINYSTCLNLNFPFCIATY